MLNFYAWISVLSFLVSVASSVPLSNLTLPELTEPLTPAQAHLKIAAHSVTSVVPELAAVLKSLAEPSAACKAWPATDLAADGVVPTYSWDEFVDQELTLDLAACQSAGAHVLLVTVQASPTMA